MTLPELSKHEQDLRRGKWAQILTAHQADVADVERMAAHDANRAAAGPEALDILGQLAIDRDIGAFRSAIDKWSRVPEHEWKPFGATSGQMFLNQLVNYAADTDELAALLVDVLAVPDSVDEAERKIRALNSWVDDVKKGAYPAPGHIPFFVSVFWSLADHESWPRAWSSAVDALGHGLLGWLPPYDDQATRYLDYREMVLALGEPPRVVEAVCRWFQEHPFVGLDPGLVQRCNDLADHDLRVKEGTATDVEVAEAESSARSVRSDLLLLAQAAKDSVADALGRTVAVKFSKLSAKKSKAPQAGGWVEWRIGAGDAGAFPGLRVWAQADGVYIGMFPGWVRDGWAGEASEALVDLIPTKYEYWDRVTEQRVALVQGHPSPSASDFFVGRRYPGTSALGNEKFDRDVVAIAADLQPLVDKLVSLIEPTPSVDTGNDPLEPLVAEFIRTRSYPTDKDRKQRVDRHNLAAILSRDELPLIEPATLSKVIGGKRGGFPGPQPLLLTGLKTASEPEFDEIVHKFLDLLWGDGPVEQRIDRLLDPANSIPGLGESVMLKLLSICHPDRFVPVFPYVGDHGKAKLMQLIGLDVPSSELSSGNRQIAANDAISNRLDTLFPNDPWGKAQFLFWLAKRKVDVDEEVFDGPDSLDALADELLVERKFLEEIIALLSAKKQVIFYGPPGTGKTYVARKLAEFLTGDESRRMLVQFHPSTSYEDFFEGYRPEITAGGQMSYRLMPGPLALLAEQAESTPGVEHIMVIDEINRANLPKVLGELLFLLEYREEGVHTLYRPEDNFELPSNLLFIGTMNTADRSIALVDAALRRRFNFIPFFPNEGAIAGLLDRWLERHSQPRWVGLLVAMVNDELRDALGGPDLQIGPSYFMQTGLDEVSVQVIWKYNVFPLIEDVLFGQREEIERFRFKAVLARLGKSAGVPGDATVAEIEAAIDEETAELESGPPLVDAPASDVS